MIIETDRLILRPWTEDDAPVLYRYARDPRVGPSAGWPPHTSVDNSREIIRTVLSAPGTFAVVLRQTGEPVGSAGYFKPHMACFTPGPNEMELGYWIGVPYWGQGLIPEAVRALQDWCFGSLGCPALWCCYYEGNVKSARVQEKCGFRPHHIETDRPCALGGTRTEHFTRLTREEWERGRQ